jgi:hypothetical protein
MTIGNKLAIISAAAGMALLLGSPVAQAGDESMSFFVTSVGMGNGANLGGVAGADAHCQKLAMAAGSKQKTWHAYLSTQTDGTNMKKRGKAARDRIGKGPWHNAKGEFIAGDLDQLHISPNLRKSIALNEKGKLVNGRGDKPNRHDILTGSKADGTAFFPWEKGDHTCNNWTSSSDTGKASVGHHDRHGGGNTSWNAAHHSRGCSQAKLKSSGGAGLFYCFAVK